MHLGGRPPVGLLCLSSFASRDKARPLLSTLTLPVQGLIGSLPLDDRRWFGRSTIEGSLKRRYREGNYFRPLGPLLTTPFIPITSKPDHLTTRLKFFCSILLPSPPILLLNIEMYMFAKSKSYQNTQVFPRFRKLLSLPPPHPSHDSLGMYVSIPSIHGTRDACSSM